MWLKVDDGFSEHPKLVEAARNLGGLHAMGRVCGMWLFGGLHASRTLSDGFIPTEVAAKLVVDRAPLEVFKAMETAGLVHFNKDRHGYEFHDWSHYQPSAERTKERRRKDRERKAGKS